MKKWKKWSEEEGVDPEVLEEQMGDFVDDSESVDSSSSEEKEKLKKKLKRAFRKKNRKRSKNFMNLPITYKCKIYLV